MTPADLDGFAALRTILRHPLIRDELRSEIRSIVGEMLPGGAVPAAGLLSTAEAAARLGVKPDAVVARIKRGDLHATKPAGAKAWRIRCEDLERFLGGERAGVQPLDLGAARRERAARLADRVRDGGKR